jgi:hypothetical protein
LAERDEELNILMAVFFQTERGIKKVGGDLP